MRQNQTMYVTNRTISQIFSLSSHFPSPPSLISIRPHLSPSVLIPHSRPSTSSTYFLSHSSSHHSTDDILWLAREYKLGNPYRI